MPRQTKPRSERNALEPIVLTVPFANETANYYKFVDRSGKFPQSYYVPRDSWDAAPSAILITIEAVE